MPGDDVDRPQWGIETKLRRRIDGYHPFLCVRASATICPPFGSSPKSPAAQGPFGPASLSPRRCRLPALGGALSKRISVAALVLVGLLLTPAVLSGAAEGRPAHAAASEQASVLILLSGQPGLPAATAIASGIRNELLTEWAFRVSIETEHIDVARFPSPEVEERRLRKVYGSKYGNQRFDVIVAALPESFQFVLRARDELWPGTPVVVCGVDERAVRDLKPPPRFAVLTIRFDMEGTVRAARALLPDTRHVALVGGASPPEQVYHDLIRQAVSAVGGLDVIDLTTLPIPDALTRVSNLPAHTVIVQSSYQVDGAGRRFHGVDLVPHVSNAANRPVFTPLGLALGRGVVGGSIIDFEDMGRDAGMLASGLLRGEALPPAPVPGRARAVPRFDGRQFARWHLDESRLPADSEVLFREPTLWQAYERYITWGVALLLVQSVLIVSLLAHRAQRRRAEAALGEQVRFERLLSDLSATVVAAPADELDQRIEQGLARLGEELDLDRVVLAKATSTQEPQISHAWARPGLAPLPRLLTASAFPWIVSRLRAGEVVRIERLDELAHEAATDRQSLQAAGTRSLLTVPLRVDDSLRRALGFSTLRRECRWPEDLVQRLQLVGQIFSHALTRQASEHAQQVSHARIQDLAGRLITTQEEERRRIARELHDDLGQQIAALAMAISRLRRLCLPDLSIAREELNGLYDRTVGLVDRTRRLSHELHPAVLEHAGLVAALKTCCAELQEEGRIAVELELAPELDAVSPEVASCIYRVVQESLRNVERHAAARRAEVVVRLKNGWIELTVRDDGRGFDVASETEGLGLVSMDERVRLVGGTVQIRSGPGKGTRILARLPFTTA
jgi:two-component system, NarL family, sensor kinase